MLLDQQKTIQREVSFSGIGLFTGANVSVTLSPTSPNSGIVFQREDLEGSPRVPASLAYVSEAPRCTRLATDQASVQMVEHLLSALYAYGIDNVIVKVKGPEIPAGDGSAMHFVELIEKAGIRLQSVPRPWLRLEKPVYWSSGETQLVALPANEFRVSYTMHYPNSKAFRSQFYSFTVGAERYKEEISSCRTFSFFEEIAPFIEKGFIKGGGLDNALIIKQDQVMNPGGSRFPDEMVRHKVLDLIGDLALIQKPFYAHILSICSGHASNVAFGRMLLKNLSQ